MITFLQTADALELQSLSSVEREVDGPTNEDKVFAIANASVDIYFHYVKGKQAVILRMDV